MNIPDRPWRDARPNDLPPGPRGGPGLLGPWTRPEGPRPRPPRRLPFLRARMRA
jgi:hypothetical protein